MTDNVTQTDEAEMQTDVVEQDITTEPAEAEEGSETTVNTPIDYDQILGGKKNKETRGGLSRKEHREKKIELEEAEESLDDIQDPDELAELREEIKEMRSLLGENLALSKRGKSIDQIDKLLAKEGVDAQSFNSKYKDLVIQEKQELINLGVPEDKAGFKALETIVSRYKGDEELERANGRGRASLPLTSQGSADKKVYKESELLAIAKKDKKQYSILMDKIDAGELQQVIGK